MRYVFIIYAITLCLYSCNRVYYAPNTPHPALFSGKDEGRINVMFASGSASDLRGGELQFAYAIQNHWGIMFNAFAAGKTENTGTYMEKGNGGYAEFAGGYFKNLDKNEDWIAELYGGLGGGNVNSDYGLGDHSKVNILKLFLQPAVGYKTKNIEFAFTPRMSLVNWKVKDESITHTEQQLQVIKENPAFFAFEPGFLFRAGSKNVKGQVGLSFSSSKMGTSIFSGLAETITLNLGLSFSFAKKKTE